MMRLLFFFILQISLVVGCKVQPDVERRGTGADLIPGGQFRYYLDVVHLTEATTPIILDHNLTNVGSFSYSIIPVLPYGMSINSVTGQISGTPLASAPQTTYNIFAYSPENTFTTSIQITVVQQTPGIIQYAGNALNFQYNQPADSGNAIPSGGSVDTYSITPTDPANGLALSALGLTYNTTTGRITGTPNQARAQWITIAATNSGGSTQTQAYLNIKDNAPTSVSYAGGPYTATVGNAFSLAAPTVAGNSYQRFFSIIPSLPAGLNFNTSTGEISGIPTHVHGSTNYTITASNNEGSASAQINLTIEAPTLSISYGTSINVYKNTSIGLITPIYSGGQPHTYTIVSQTRPGGETNDLLSAAGGIVLNTATGRLTGAPIHTMTEGSYTATISAQGFGGSAVQTTITFVVRPEPTNSLNYPVSNIFYKDQPLTTIVPNPSGGNINLTYSISPDITVYSGNPTGLTFNAATGAISGTPTLLMPETNFVVTATNSDAQTVSQNIVIRISELAPNYLGYVDYIQENDHLYDFSTGRLLLTQGVAVDPINPKINSMSGLGRGIPSSYQVSPTLPNGIIFNPLTGEISGMPTAVIESRSYTIRGTNSAGFFSETINLEVRPGVPTSIDYAIDPVHINVQDSLNNVATVTPDPTVVPMSFTVTPALPSGMVLNASNGTITATPPLGAVANTTFTITASTAHGSLDKPLQIRVDNINLGAGAIAYNTVTTHGATPKLIFEKGEAQTELPSLPNYTGGTGGQVVRWQIVAGALPAGLVFNQMTGEISGTPTTESALGQLSLEYAYTANPTAFNVTVRGFRDNPGTSTTPNVDHVDLVLPIMVTDERPDYFFNSPDTDSGRFIASAGQVQSVLSLGNGLYTDGGRVAHLNGAGASTTSCTVSPSLPAYFSINAATCEITSNGSASMCGLNAESSYSMTFTNNNGTQASVPFSILVADAPGLYSNPLNIFRGDLSTPQVLSPSYGTCPPPASVNYTLGSPLLPSFLFDGTNGDLTSNIGMALRTRFSIQGQTTLAGEEITNTSEFSSQTNYSYDGLGSPTTIQKTISFDFNRDGKEDILVYSSDTLRLMRQAHSGVFTRDTVLSSYALPIGTVINSVVPVRYNNASAFGYDTAVVFNSLSGGTTTLHFVNANNTTLNATATVTGVSGPQQLLASKRAGSAFSNQYTVFYAYKTAANINIKVFQPQDSSGLILQDQETITIPVSSIPVSDTLIDMAILDFNGDGYNDIALATTSGVCLLKSSGSEYNHANICETTLGGSGTPLQVIAANLVDAGNNNREDLMVLRNTSGNGTVHVYENDGNSFTSTFTPVFSASTGIPAGNLALSNGKKAFVADHNEDNLPDIFVMDSANSRMLLYRATGSLPWFDYSVTHFTQDANSQPLFQSTSGREVSSVPIYDNTLQVIGVSLIQCEVNATHNCAIPALLRDMRQP